MMAEAVPLEEHWDVEQGFSPSVQPGRERYPYCIVWTPIPCITWFLPFVGHMGIADSSGKIYDFAGPYTITEDNLSFGKTTRYLQLDGSKARRKAKRPDVESWDEGVQAGSAIYRGRVHNLCLDNCHSHVAECLELMEYNGRKEWNMLILGTWMFFFGKFVSFGRLLKSIVPSLVLWSMVYLFFYAL